LKCDNTVVKTKKKERKKNSPALKCENTVIKNPKEKKKKKKVKTENWSVKTNIWFVFFDISVGFLTEPAASIINIQYIASATLDPSIIVKMIRAWFETFLVLVDTSKSEKYAKSILLTGITKARVFPEPVFADATTFMNLSLLSFFRARPIVTS